MSDFSLANLAGLDTSEMEAITTRVPAEGRYVVKGMDVTITEGQEGTPQPPLSILLKGEVMLADPVDQGIDPEALEGRILTYRHPLWDMEAVATLMGNFKKAGLPHKGPMLDEDHQPTGWLVDFIGATVVWRITHGRTKKNDIVANFRWMPYEPAE